MARTYNESKSVYLAGPIEYWWDKFDEPRAIFYRKHREAVKDFFVKRNYLCYSPWNAFKGDWNEKMQPVNDYVLGLCDIVVNLSPQGILGNGTKGELILAKELGKTIIELPPIEPDYSKWLWNTKDSFSKNVIEMILETERLNHGW